MRLRRELGSQCGFRYSRRGRGGGGVLEEVKEIVIFLVIHRGQEELKVERQR